MSSHDHDLTSPMRRSLHWRGLHGCDAHIGIVTTPRVLANRSLLIRVLAWITLATLLTSSVCTAFQGSTTGPYRKLVNPDGTNRLAPRP